VSDGKDVWKDIGKVEGAIDSFRNQIRDIWAKLDEREEIDTIQNQRLDQLEKHTETLGAPPISAATKTRWALERNDYPKVALAVLFIIGGLGSAIGWWTWIEFRSWLVDAWRTLGSMIGFGGGSTPI